MTTPAKSAIGLFLAILLFAAGYVANRPPAGASAASSRQILYYTCPMHPEYKSNHTGNAPCCGMRLVPVYAGLGAADGQPGAIRVGTERQQLIGVRTGEVRRGSATIQLRVPGRVVVDESRLYRIVATVDGWIRELGENTTGSSVAKDQILASYYTPNLLAAAQTYVYALATSELPAERSNLGPQRGGGSLNLQVAVDSLRTLGMSDLQLEEIRRTRRSAAQVHVYSPTNGYVLARGITPGQRFEKGAELYRIADISRVWVTARVSALDRRLLRPGMRATVRHGGLEYSARMATALPQLDTESRTVKARFEVDNAAQTLYPDDFVDVELRASLPPAVTVPPDAVIDTGLQSIVYVELGPGIYTPREVRTGWQTDDQVQVLDGLKPGERIVLSGTFLIDSESRRQRNLVATRLAAAPAKTAKDPICGMEVDPKAADTIKAEYRGTTYYFCSEYCRKRFKASGS